MYYKIYPDVIFLTNLLLDYTVLAVSCRLCKITTTYLRLTIAAGIGAAWSVMVAVVGNEGITVLFCTYLCMPVAMLYIAGCRGGPGEWLYRYAVLMGVAVLLGGVMSQAHDRSSTVLVTMVTAVLFLQAAVPLVGYLTGYVKRKICFTRSRSGLMEEARMYGDCLIPEIHSRIHIAENLSV